MKQTLLFTLTSFAISVLMTGCTGQVAVPGISSSDKEKECANIDKKLVKVDRFLTVVNDTSSFHLEEAASAFETPGITASNNKTRMLKDGNKRRAELEAEHQKLGCEPLEK